MQGMGNHRVFTSAQIMSLAFAAALCLHVVILLVRLDLSQTASSVNKTLSIEIQPPTPLIEEVAPDVDPPKEKIEPEVEPQPQQEPQLDKEPQPVKEPQPQQTTASITAADVITSQPDEPQPDDQAISVPSIHSDEFQRFLRSELENETNRNPDGEREFSDSFIAPAKPDISDTNPNVGPLGGPLGGGSFKTRRNGVECENLKMVPQSFDDLTGSTIRTSGNCKDLNKKIDLVDENGRIRNSDRYDWD